MSSCFFIGHRDTPDSIRPLLEQVIERHIVVYGVTEFYVGHQGRFDSMAAHALARAKERHLAIRNYLLLAYHPSVMRVEKPAGFACTLLPEGQESVPPRFAVVRRNRRMLREADYLICYVRGVTGGSYKLLQTAKGLEKKGRLTITNLAECT